jgi:cytochrome c oxidase assembly protein CtaG/Cox11
MISKYSTWILVFMALLALFALPVYLLRSENAGAERELFKVADAYLRSAYARDYKRAYQLISARDRRLKDAQVYAREKGSFSGFALQVTRKLSDLIQIRPLQTDESDDQARIKLAVRYPDANSLSGLLYDWDEERLNALSPAAEREVLAKIDQLSGEGKLPSIAGEEEFTLLREGRNWRIFFDWAAGVHIRYSALVPSTQSIAAAPVNEETTVRPGELFTIAYRVKNRSLQPITTRIVHRIEPQELQDYVDIVECALLLPVKVLAGEESEFSTTYMMRTDFPEAAKEVNITYDFQVSN